MDKEKLFAKFTPVELFQMTLISLGGMIILTFLTGIYIFFWTDFSLFFRILALVNTLFGVLFLSSTFISSYQSYQMVKLADMGQGMDTLIKSISDNLIADVSKIKDYPDEITERSVKQ